jgi:hypothetical protein
LLRRRFSFPLEGLLLLSLNVRLMGMVSCLRAYLRNKHLAGDGRIEESKAYGSQIASIEHRAEMIRRAFVSTLYSLLWTVATCLLLRLGLYWQYAQGMAALLFVFSMIVLLVGLIHYVSEVSVALSSVREEVADSRFMGPWLTGWSFCTKASERVYITASGCEIEFGETRGL